MRGNPSDDLSSKAHHVIETIHNVYSRDLIRFDGDRSVFEKTDTLLSECLISKKLAPKEKKKPWLAIVVIIAVIVVFSHYQFKQYQFEQGLNDIEALIRGQQSYVIVKIERLDNGLDIELLRSPDSRPPSDLLDALSLKTANGDDVAVQIKDTIVHFGPLPAPPELPEAVPLSKQEIYSNLVSAIEGSAFYFGPKETQLDLVELGKLTNVVNDIKSLLSLTNELSLQLPQLSIIGFADNMGTEFGNKTVSQKRAETLALLLRDNGITLNPVVAWGVGNVDSDTVDEKHQRRVNIIVTPKTIEVKNINGVLK